MTSSAFTVRTGDIARATAVDELGQARDDLGRLPVTPGSRGPLLDRDAVLALIRDRVDSLTDGGTRAPSTGARA